jgi:hypothetical protein
MRYDLLPLILMLANVALSQESEAFVDLECPNQFQIQQDAALRLFRMIENEKYLGIIASSDYGVLDFYDSEEEKQWVNRLDSLYDNRGQCIGVVKLASDTEWFWERRNPFLPSTHIEIFSDEEELLATVEAEGDGKCFVFRDAENGNPLAIALWSWVPTGTFCLSWCLSLFDYYVQNWEVIVLDRSRLQERKIPNVFLVWALLKHSQKHFPDPNRIKYTR